MLVVVLLYLNSCYHCYYYDDDGDDDDYDDDDDDSSPSTYYTPINERRAGSSRTTAGPAAWRSQGISKISNRFEILRDIFRFKKIRVFVSSSWGPLTVSFRQYPWNPLRRSPAPWRRTRTCYYTVTYHAYPYTCKYIKLRLCIYMYHSYFTITYSYTSRY